MTENKMVEWHHRFNRHAFKQTPGDGEGKESLACCSLWGLKESDTTEQLNKDNNQEIVEERGTWHTAVHGVAKSWT